MLLLSKYTTKVRQVLFPNPKFLPSQLLTGRLALPKISTIFNKRSKNKISFTGIYLVLTLLFGTITSQAQTDQVNFLPELKTKFNKSQRAELNADLAIKICSFYLTNKVQSPAILDSALSYILTAENLSRKANTKKVLDDALVQKTRVLLLQGKWNQAQEIIKPATEVLYCRLHLILGRYFLEKDGEENSDLIQASENFATVEAYSRKRGWPELLLTSRFWQYKTLLERNLVCKISDDYLDATLLLCKKYGHREFEGRLLFEKGLFAKYHNETIVYLPIAYTHAKASKDTATMILCLNYMADFKAERGKREEARTDLMTSLSMSRDIGYRNHELINSTLSDLYYIIGDYETAMRYSILAARESEKSETDNQLVRIYYKLGDICDKVGLKRESLQWYQKSIDISLKLYNVFQYGCYRPIAQDLIKKGKASEVLKTLNSLLNKYTDYFKYAESIKGDCYLALGMPERAEHQYLKLINFLQKGNQKDVYFYAAYKSIASFYISQHKFSAAEPYVDSILAAPKSVNITGLADAELYKFKIDSAKGNYFESIQHFQRSKLITDSIFNQTKLRQSQQLQLQYATAKRDQENLQLRNANLIQKNDLVKESSQKKIIAICLLAASILTILMTYLFKVKQNSNTLLRSSQKEINLQNKRLFELLNEKEWLMKEIHHRVKNNLQIISSLLNTQLSFLSNEEAKTAIRDSQNRMKAISIVHQKLYQSDDISLINLKSYIQEISKSIIDSFTINSNIGFKFEIEDAELTTTETVPLGLILNEAITNSVKYAFSEGYGIISVIFEKCNDGWYKLTIRDNGTGLPDDFDIDACRSLGVNLIVGLSHQLLGTFDIHSDSGTVITITFPPSQESA